MANPARCLVSGRRALSGRAEGTVVGPREAKQAARSLDFFSVLLVAEWLAASAPLLKRHLGWAITDFEAFHEKENAALKVDPLQTSRQPAPRAFFPDGYVAALPRIMLPPHGTLSSFQLLSWSPRVRKSR